VYAGRSAFDSLPFWKIAFMQVIESQDCGSWFPTSGVMQETNDLDGPWYCGQKLKGNLNIKVLVDFCY
jgi:hypothetical protein